MTLSGGCEGRACSEDVMRCEEDIAHRAEACVRSRGAESKGVGRVKGVSRAHLETGGLKMAVAHREEASSERGKV